MVLAGLLVGILAGCSGAGDVEATMAEDAADDGGSDVAPRSTAGDDAGVDLDTDTAWDEPEEAAEGDDAAGAEAGDGDQAVTVAPAALGRRVIRTATLELESADPDQLARQLTATVTAAGGFVATSDLHRDERGVLSGVVTVRVPSRGLDGILDELEGLADNAPIRRIDERDVTVESADLEAQLTNLTAYEAELRTLLADVRETTSRPEDLLTVFERVRQVRAEIDQIQGRLAVLEDQVSLATITVTITPTAAGQPVTDPTWQPGETAREALTAAARALSGLADAAIWVALAILPVLLVLAIPAGGMLIAYRRARRRGGSGPVGPSTPPPATPVA
jgi:hypothetical protein